MNTAQKIKSVLKRDGPYCALCSIRLEDEDRINLDHKNPKSKGGGDEVWNLQLTHYECNQIKANGKFNIRDLGRVLIKKPNRSAAKPFSEVKHLAY